MNSTTVVNYVLYTQALDINLGFVVQFFSIVYYLLWICNNPIFAGIPSKPLFL